MFAHVEEGGVPTRVSLWFSGSRQVVIRNLEELPPFVRYTRAPTRPLEIETSTDGEEFSTVTNPTQRFELSYFLLLDPHTLLLTGKGGRLESEEEAPLGEIVMKRREADWAASVIQNRRLTRFTTQGTERYGADFGWGPSFALEGFYQPDLVTHFLAHVNPLETLSIGQAPQRRFRVSFVGGLPQELIQQDPLPESEVVSTVFHWP